MTEFDKKYLIVKKKKGFYFHLMTFILVGAFLALINLLEDPGEIWFPIPLAAWAIGLGLHYVGVFGIPGKDKILSKEWEKREMEKELLELGDLNESMDGPLDLNKHDSNMKESLFESKKWDEDDFV